MCRNCEFSLTGVCLAGEALSICEPKGNSLCSILIVTGPAMQLAVGFTESQAGSVEAELMTIKVPFRLMAEGDRE